MKVTHVALRATDAARNHGSPELTPELLAATGARYSRNNDGLESILSKIDPSNPDKSVDSIFKMVDYGHQSIADMAPVAIFMDGISMWLAYLVWTQVPTAGGQESSTRYLRLTPEDIASSAELGMPDDDEWRGIMEACMKSYANLEMAWSKLAQIQPELTRIPAELLADESDKAKKQVARMQRNYAFDRARYFLPAALRTNMVLVMSARAWVQLCQFLRSNPSPEAAKLGELLAEELALSAPRLLRHAVRRDSTAKVLADELESYRQLAPESATIETLDRARLHVDLPTGVSEAELVKSLQHRDNRYGFFGSAISRTAVRFAWDAMAFAEIRDLNRHRTGTKYCPAIPVGFYSAKDQAAAHGDVLEAIEAAEGHAHRAHMWAHEKLDKGDPSYVYGFLLGTQMPFEHTTTADKFIYEAELRTGVGAHYRYAKHLHDVLELWYAKFPTTRNWIMEGEAEPE